MPLRPFVFSLALVASVLSLPIPWYHNHVTTNSKDTTHSGQGGSADGGSVRGSDVHSGLLPIPLEGASVLNVFSNNAGQGGAAGSGPVVASDHTHRSGTGGNTETINDANTYSGGGGHAAGGSVENPDIKLVNLWSGNGGRGGWANSGSVSKLSV